jgi:hypothetical protein
MHTYSLPTNYNTLKPTAFINALIYTKQSYSNTLYKPPFAGNPNIAKFATAFNAVSGYGKGLTKCNVIKQAKLLQGLPYKKIQQFLRLPSNHAGYSVVAVHCPKLWALFMVVNYYSY